MHYADFSRLAGQKGHKQGQEKKQPLPYFIIEL
jgi:hypothetical protein